MGRGHRNTGPKLKAHSLEGLSPDAERVYKRIRQYAEQCMQADYAQEVYEYRVRYRYGYPSRIHYSWKTRRLLHLMDLLARKEIGINAARNELERIKH